VQLEGDSSLPAAARAQRVGETLGTWAGVRYNRAMVLRRRPHIGLDLALPEDGPGLVVMELPEGSPLADRVEVGARLLAIDGVPVTGLDDVRDRVRELVVGDECVLSFDHGTVRQVLEPLPLEPNPGRVELDEVEVPSEGYALRTIWTFPNEPGPHPVVWLMPSANWLSEEHTQELWHPTLKLVRALTERGFATLRVDRSGVGDSEGPPCVDTDFDTELAWCRAGHAHLLAHPEVDPDRVFFFGRSLGGTLVQLLAAELGARAAAVWGATAIPWHDAMMATAERQLRLKGVAEEPLRRHIARRRRLSEAVLIGGELPRAVLAREPELTPAKDEFTGGRVHGRLARFFQQLQALDVAGACGRFAGPMLIMRGELDWITGEDDAASVVAAARHPTFRSFAGIDHLMHRREDMAEASAHIFGGDFDPAGADAMIEFFRAS